MDQVARDEWDRLTTELSAAGTITQIDRTVLTLHVAAYSRWQHARQQVDVTGGMVVKAPSGFPVLNPWASVARRAFDEMLRTASELGLSPVARARLAGKATRPAATPKADAPTNPLSRLRVV
jgi:P27 family predicted phage terminase small subunit